MIWTIINNERQRSMVNVALQNRKIRIFFACISFIVTITRMVPVYMLMVAVCVLKVVLKDEDMHKLNGYIDKFLDNKN